METKDNIKKVVIGNNFNGLSSVYDIPCDNANELLYHVLNKNNEVVEGVNNITDELNKKVSHEELNNDYKLVIENGTPNYTGKWHGLDKPTLSEEGAHAQVEKNMNDIKELNSQLDNIHNNIIPEVTASIDKIKSKLELNIKDFGAIGDGVTDDTEAFEKAFEYIKSIQSDKQKSVGHTLKFVDGIYIIDKDFEIDFSVSMVGESLGVAPNYRLYGENASSQSMRPNTVTIKYKTPRSNSTMFTPIKGEYGVDFYIKNITLDGNDGVVKHNTVSGVEKDHVIEFTSTNCNGLDLSQGGFLQGTNNVFCVGFSGFGMKTYMWQSHENYMSSLCGVGLVVGSDCSVVNPLIHNCKTGVEVRGVTSRVINIRTEWNEEYGIRIIEGGSSIITGFIDRCGYNGLFMPETWNPNINLTIQRCGCAFKNADFSSLSEANKTLTSNAHIHSTRFGKVEIISLRSGESDTGGIKTPIQKGVHLEGCHNSYYNVISGGFDITNPVYKTNNSDCVVGENGKMYIPGIVDYDLNNRKIFDLFTSFRFRLPANWGSPSTSDYQGGDMYYDLEVKKIKVLIDGAWKTISFE